MTGLHDVEGDVRARLALVMGGPVEGLERLSGGASRETWAFRAGERDLILRRDPPGRAGGVGAMRLAAGGVPGAARARPAGSGGAGAPPRGPVREPGRGNA